MKRHKGFTWAMVAAIALTLTACGNGGGETGVVETGGGTPAEETASVKENGDEFQEMTIRLGHGSSPADDDPYHVLATYFAENVAEATGGKVTIEIFPSGQLGGEMDSYEGLGMGTVDMCIATGNIFGLYNEKTTILDLPFLFEDEEAARKLLDSELVAGLMEELTDTTNAVHLGWGEGGFRNIFNNVRPVYTPEDLAGIKLRVPETTIFVDTFNALGANVTPMTYSECYTGIQQATIDGIEVPISNGYTMGFHDVCQYYSLTRHFYNALSISISKGLYDSFSPELQQIMKEAAVQAGIDQREFLMENEARQLGEMENAGLKVNEIENLEEWRNKVSGIYENYEQNVDGEIYTEAMEILGLQ